MTLNRKQADEILTRLETARVSDPLEYERIKLELFEASAYLATSLVARYRGMPNYEDLKQEAMLGLWKAIASYRHGKGSYFTWVKLYITTLIMRRIGETKDVIKIPPKVFHRVGSFYCIGDEYLGTMTSTHDPSAGCQRKSELAQLERCITALPSELQRIMRAYLAHDLRISTAARSLHMSAPKFKELLNLANQQLSESVLETISSDGHCAI